MNQGIQMTISIKASFLLMLLMSLTLQAGEFTFADAKIQIPAGFEGPMTQDMGNGMSNIGFRKPHKENQHATLLQISVWSPGQRFPSLTNEELKQGASKYLLQFLSGVARKRSDFKKSDIEFVEISGVPAAKVKWTGNFDNISMHGVMYCYVYNSKIISLHTQDMVDFEGVFINKAVASFESITLKK